MCVTYDSAQLLLTTMIWVYNGANPLIDVAKRLGTILVSDVWERDPNPDSTNPNNDHYHTNPNLTLTLPRRLSPKWFVGQTDMIPY